MSSSNTSPTTVTTDCSSPSTVSIALLVVGITFFLIGLALIIWVVFYLKTRKDQRKPLPMAPRVDGSKCQASGEYIDIQDDSNKYEAMNSLGNKHASRYVAQSNRKDPMDETFDGSRMPTTNAPKPPNHPSKSVLASVKKEDGLTESGNNIYEDYGNDAADNNGSFIGKLKGRISQKFDSSYDTPRKSTTMGSVSKMTRPPPKSKRNTMR